MKNTSGPYAHVPRPFWVLGSLEITGEKSESPGTVVEESSCQGAGVALWRLLGDESILNRS